MTKHSPSVSDPRDRPTSAVDDVRHATEAAAATPAPGDQAAAPKAAATSAFTPRTAGLLVLLALMWGHSFLFIKVAVRDVEPVWVMSGRIAIGGVLLLAIVAIRRRPLPRDPRLLLALGGIGVFGVAMPWAIQAWAQQFLDSGLLSVLNATAPASTLLVAVAVGQERAHRRRVLGLLVAITGTLIIVGFEIDAGRSPLALVAGAGATLAYGAGGVWTKASVSGRVGALPGAAAQLLLAALVVLPIALVTAEAPLPSRVDALPALALLGLGVFGTGLAFLAYFALIQEVGATNAAMVTYVVPLVGLTAGVVYLGEQVGPDVLIGAAVLIFGVWLAQREPPAATATGGSADG